MIDDVALTTGTAGPDITDILPASGAAAYEVTWNIVTGPNYQFQTSNDLSAWDNIGAPMLGTGAAMSATDFRDGTEKSYRAKIVP